ncbi:hypothetical protein TraAM80_07183 [Trypanosoma rangeli]|uniref:RING-type domain-containing protein n=1 Tax=Trypanosoma rangeli TaxID=5698 RepID=A0A3R7M836_TRYRA|nr:uncharacterized protein TraAM80_07183 [Trypanosoma rangeli]RNF01131.1 hypothetical protein TraAM80_07183 [Trypanosoma rangeli]|eukprot:RNF01131.1 hypothetical protein TraAM80_07183 [Trypanosoma rangeli]
MFLLDAMRHAECSICLQTLSLSAGGSPSPSNGGSPAKKLPSPPRASPVPRHAESRLDEGEFQITFAPGVSRSHTADDVMTFITALDAYHRAVKKGSRHSRASRDAGGGLLSCGAEQGIVVLPCGHLLHFLCAIQLHEYSNSPTCPICRQALKKTEDYVLFVPRPRPTLTERSMAVDGEGNTCESNRSEEGGGDEVQFAGERCVAPSEAYRSHIQREADELRRRRRNLRSREHFLTSSRDQLEEQCISLEQSASDARRRYDVLTRQGTVGLDRLKELRDVVLKTHTSMEQLTLQLASLLRQQRDVDQQLEKYSQRLQRGRLNRRRESTADGEGGGVTREDYAASPLQKKRVERPMAGALFSYYVSRD